MTASSMARSVGAAPAAGWVRIPMARGRWEYTLGDGGAERGVYQLTDSGREWQAPLAYCHGHFIGPRGAEGIISATPDGPRVTAGHSLIKDGSWASMLDLPLCDDRPVINAANWALRDIISASDTVRPAPWIDEGGRMQAPETGCLPAGYLDRADTDPLMALDAWRAVADTVAGLPAMAFMLGLSAIAPFWAAAGYRSLVCELYGDPGKGKTTTLRLAAAVWGDPAGVIIPFSGTARGMERHLGQLSILPGIADETGMAAFSADDWRRLLFGVSEGNERITARRDPSGTYRANRWDSVFFMSGNGQVTDGIATGAHAGLRRRVISVPAPFTDTPEQAEALTGADGDPGLLGGCYGHLGAGLLGRYAVADVQRFCGEAAALLGELSAEPVARDLGRYMRGGLAGVLMVAELLGAGPELAAAAAAFARDYLAEHGHAPEHDADRFLAAVLDSMGREGARWPAELGYGKQDRDPARGVAGVWSDDGSALWVFPGIFRELCETAGLDRVIVCRELHGRDLLRVTGARRATETGWQIRKRLGGGPPNRVYEIDAAAFAGDEDQADVPELPTAPPAAGPPPMPWGEGPSIGDEVNAASRVAAARPAVARAAATLGRMAPETRACSVCGQPMTVVEAGQATHPGCPDPDPAPAPQAAGLAPLPAPLSTDGLRAVHREFMAQVKARRVFKGGQAEAQLGALADRLPILDKIGAKYGEGSETYPALRIQAALEDGDTADGRKRAGPFAPAAGPKMKCCNGRPGHAMRLRPRLPDVIEIAQSFTGWGYSRDDYSGPAVALDVSGSFFSAASSVTVPHGDMQHTGPYSADQPGTVPPGLFLVSVQRWDETGMPSPLRHARPGDEVWVPSPIFALLREQHQEGRWLDGGAIDSWTGEATRLADWAHFMQELRRYAVARYGRGSDAFHAIKTSFGQARGDMKGNREPGQAREWPQSRATRMDISLLIEAQAAATLWRAADRCRKAARKAGRPELGPLALRACDDLVIPAAALDIVTADPGDGTRPPVRLDPDGIEFGTFKVKGTESWGK